jgi:hypothetical protein
MTQNSFPILDSIHFIALTPLTENNGNFPLEIKDILNKGKDCHVFPKSALFILSLKI